ncbi:MAG: N-acetylmuramoyl-L-alanine amidase [bacterium]
MKMRKMFKSVFLLICFAILISGYTQSIERKYSVVFEGVDKSDLKTTMIKGKEYVNLDNVFSSLFPDAGYNKNQFIINFSDCQLIFAPNYFIAMKSKNGIQTFQMSEPAIVSSSNLFLPVHSLLKSLESFKIFRITKNKYVLNVKKLRETTDTKQVETEIVSSEIPPNVYMLPPKLNRKGMKSDELEKDKIQLTDNSKNSIALQTQNLKGLWFLKVFAEQKNGYIDLHFIANSIIDVYHRPECDGKSVIIRIPNANNNITDFSKAESVYPITKITATKVRQFQIYTLTLSDNLIKCTSRRNGDKEIIFSLYPANPKKPVTTKEVKVEKKLEQIKPEVKEETPVIEKPIKTEETPKIADTPKTEDKDVKIPTISPNIEKEKKKWELDVIVLDPGHGGNDAGAVGVTSVYEKVITLKLAKKVRDLLKEEMPQTKVVLTRENDTFVELYKRGQIANKAEGKLFISIHLNAANRKPSPANGVETFILRPGRNDDAIRVANFENSVIKFEKQTDKYKKLTDEEIIIATMAQSAFVKFSELFARILQNEVCKVTKLEDRGVKQAGFYVLIGASMPNVLFEACFLSNEGDERFANSEAGQLKIARGIVNAIMKYAEEYGKY